MTKDRDQDALLTIREMSALLGVSRQRIDQIMRVYPLEPARQDPPRVWWESDAVDWWKSRPKTDGPPKLREAYLNKRMGTLRYPPKMYGAVERKRRVGLDLLTKTHLAYEFGVSVHTITFWDMRDLLPKTSPVCNRKVKCLWDRSAIDALIEEMEKEIGEEGAA